MAILDFRLKIEERRRAAQARAIWVICLRRH